MGNPSKRLKLWTLNNQHLQQLEDWGSSTAKPYGEPNSVHYRWPSTTTEQQTASSHTRWVLIGQGMDGCKFYCLLLSVSLGIKSYSLKCKLLCGNIACIYKRTIIDTRTLSSSEILRKDNLFCPLIRITILIRIYTIIYYLSQW